MSLETKSQIEDLPSLKANSKCAPIFAPLIFLLGSSFLVSGVYVREVTDHCGRPVLDKVGNPILEKDHWATIINQWIAYSLFTVAIGLTVFALYDWGRVLLARKAHGIKK